MIYNVPGRTGVNINSQTTIRLANDCPKIIGIKEASGNLVQVSEITCSAPEGFSLMSGEDALNLPYMSCGAMGTISVTANIMPFEVHNLIDFALKNKYQEAKEIHLKLLELNQQLFIETNPIPVKHALFRMGKIHDELRLPMYKLSDSNKISLDATLRKYELI